MKLAVVGSRSFDDYFFLSIVMDENISSPRMTTIISGGAKGADSLAKLWASNNKVDYKEYPADWANYGRKAGFIRNEQIALNADKCIAFWDGESKGTKHTIDLFIRLKKPVLIMPF